MPDFSHLHIHPIQENLFGQKKLHMKPAKKKTEKGNNNFLPITNGMDDILKCRKNRTYKINNQSEVAYQFINSNYYSFFPFSSFTSINL